METIREFFSRLRELESLLTWGGYPVLMFIIFAETGLLVGFFLPGDSLLVTAGVLVNAGLINPFGLSTFANLLLMNVVLMAMAILGDAVGYQIGFRAGPALFRKKKSFFFRQDHLVATQAFYEKHGGKTIILARFMPFARTFAPVVAGIAKMPYRRFALFNITGGVLWIFSMTFLGYFLGKVFDAKQIEKVIYLIIFVSVSPVAYGAIKSWWVRRKVPMGEITSEVITSDAITSDAITSDAITSDVITSDVITSDVGPTEAGTVAARTGKDAE